MPTVELNPRYVCLTLVWLGAITWLSSMPEQTNTESNRLADIVSNFAHVPVFAALAFCWLKAIARGRPSAMAIGVAFLASSACAVVDEWHQSFVPGRNASMGDVFLDLAGIGGMLFILYRRGSRGSGPHQRPSQDNS